MKFWNGFWGVRPDWSERRSASYKLGIAAGYAAPKFCFFLLGGIVGAWWF